MGFFPLDDELGLLPGLLTPRLQEGLVRLSTHIPSFAKAASEFAFWTQLEVHRTTASRITEAAGAAVVARETAEAERILRTHPLAPPGPERLVLSVDGAMVPLLHGQWAEARTLAVGEPSLHTTAEGQQELHTSALSYFSRLTTSATFGELASVEIQRRGVETAGQVAAVVDGAEWCQTFLDQEFLDCSFCVVGHYKAESEKLKTVFISTINLVGHPETPAIRSRLTLPRVGRHAPAR